METDDVRRAWAVFGLSPGAGIGAVRKRYRLLAKRWHPDRFVGDVGAQAEAGVEMRRLNAAYRRLLDACRDDEVRVNGGFPAGGSPVAAGLRGRRLTREQIDAMVAAIGPPSWIEWVVESIPGGPQAERLFVWLVEKRRLRGWKVAPGIAITAVLAAGYAVLGGLALAGIDTREGPTEYLVGGSMGVGVLAVVLMLRGRRAAR